MHCMKIIIILRDTALNMPEFEVSEDSCVPTATDAAKKYILSQAQYMITNLKNIPTDDKNGSRFRNELTGALAYLGRLKHWPLYSKYLSDEAVQLFKAQIVFKVEKLAGLVY